MKPKDYWIVSLVLLGIFSLLLSSVAIREFFFNNPVVVLIAPVSALAILSFILFALKNKFGLQLTYAFVALMFLVEIGNVVGIVIGRNAFDASTMSIGTALTFGAAALLFCAWKSKPVFFKASKPVPKSQ